MQTAHSYNPSLTARTAGILSLLNIAGGIFAQGYVSNRLVSFTDATLTANNFLANRSLVQAGFSVYLIEMACQIAAIALYYALLRPVNRNVALVAAFLELTGCMFKTFSRVFFITPLFVLSSGAEVLSAFDPEQLRALALLLLRINDRGAGMAMGFFGASGVLFGYLMFRSTFLPRTLGILVMIGSAGWLRWFYPPLRFPSFMVVVGLALLVGAVKIFWLIVYGVDDEKWRERNRMM